MSKPIKSLWEAAQAGDADKVYSLVKGELNERDQLALHYAAQKGHIDVVRILLENNFDVNRKAKNNNSPLHLAAQNGHTEVCRLLLDHGADSTAASATGTPAAVAKDNRTREVIENFAPTYNNYKSERKATNPEGSAPPPRQVESPSPKVPRESDRLISYALEENWDAVGKIAQTLLEIPPIVHNSLPLGLALRLEEEFHSVHSQAALNAKEKAESNQAKLVDLNETLRDAQDRLSLEQRDVERLEAELKRAKESLSNTQREVTKTKGEIDQVQRRLTVDTREADRYSDVLVKEEKRLVELKTQLDEFKAKLIGGDLTSLSVADVTVLLSELRMGKYREKFTKEKVNGKVLDRLSEGDLRTDLGIESLADRKRLISLINKVKSRTIELPLTGATGAGPLKWGVQEVVEWLQKHDLGEYSRKFKDEQITGDVLLSLSSDDLRTYLKMERLGDRIAILEEIKKLQEQVQTHSQDEI